MIQYYYGYLMAIFIILSAPFVHANTVHLTSLDWPPYSSKDLPNEGASIAVAKAAFAAMGYELKVTFLPWSRAVALAKNSDQYVGYFPEYFFETSDFVFSDAIGQGPLGFVEHQEAPIHWQTLDDLRGKTIGVVQDYVNTEAFDDKIANNEIDAEPVLTDAQNIMKVAHKRIELAVIDPYVLAHLLGNHPSLLFANEQVQMNPTLLVIKALHVAFDNSEKGQRYQALFNEGLQKIDVDAIMAEHIPSRSHHDVQ